MIDPNAQRAVAAAECIEALPATVTRAMSAIYSSRSEAREVAEIIGLDPALAGRILRLVNSPHHIAISRPVAGLTEAVLRLGYKAVQSALLMAATTSLLDPPLMRYGLRRHQFWHHSVATAICARSIANEVRFPGAEETYVAGLLHDVGKIGLDRQHANSLTNVRNLVSKQGMSYSEAERAEVGFDHAYVGQLVALKWSLSPPTSAAIGAHHGDMAGADLIAAIVSVGDALAWQMGFVGGGDAAPHSIDKDALGNLNLGLAAIERLTRDTTALVRETLGVFQAVPAMPRR
jgi:putative nucleotidyltransferase with HDIG domain